MLRANSVPTDASTRSMCFQALTKSRPSFTRSPFPMVFRYSPCYQLFSASLPSFCTPAPLFSIACSLFSKNMGGGGIPTSVQPQIPDSAWARPEWWTRSQWTRAHAEAWTQRRRNVAQRIPAARATPLFAKGARGVRAQPVPSRFALRIDALHREARQELHIVSPQRPAHFAAPVEWRGPDSPRDERPKKPLVGADSGPARLRCQEGTPQYIVCALPTAVGTFDAMPSERPQRRRA